MPIPNASIEEIFAHNGILAKHFSYYTPRQSQITMALAVANSLKENTTLICEASTGTGKTYAYLIPAIRMAHDEQKQIVISTGTKNLQDQLFQRDLPKLLNILNKPIAYCQIKGRSNYLCLAKLDQANNDNWQDTEIVRHINYIKRNHRQTDWGEVGEFSQLEENSMAWKLLTSTNDNCLAHHCEYFDDCYIYKAREKALFADIVIVNHHLLMSDMILKQEGKNPLLADFDACIVDEAHQMIDIASHFYSISFSSKQIKNFLKDVWQANIDEAGEKEQLEQHIDLFRQQLDALNFYFLQIGGDKSWQFILQALGQQFLELKKTMSRLVSLLETMQLIGKNIQHCFQRSQKLLSMMNKIFDNQVNNSIHWYETYRSDFTIYLTPLDIAAQYSEHSQTSKVAWIYTSATLSSLNNFNLLEPLFDKPELSRYFQFFTQQLGLDNSTCLSLPSPFNYAQQALFYHPNELPEPAHGNFVEKLVDTSLPILHRLQGKTFFLFTSYRAMYQAYEILLKHELGCEFNLLVQGKQPKQEMLERFIKEKNSVLLGTYSFWQGVDVPGQALSCVIIEKLPFASPNEPVTAAKLAMLKQQQLHPFYSYQIPQAIISLKQGIGRLIRSLSDYGVLIIADRRIYTKSYGKMFRDILPNMPSTHCFNEVDKFLTDHEQGTNH